MEARHCDCAGHHMVFPERSVDAVAWELLHPPERVRLPHPVPAKHDHEDARCSKHFLGIGGCPGLPHCRSWIIGSYRAGETIASVTGNGAREFEIRMQREGLEREFARRTPLAKVSP